MKKAILAMVVAGMSTGCATIMNESSQAIRVETKTENGTPVAGATCTLKNDYGTVNVKSGESVSVHRSSADLDVVCKDPANPDATARAISRANAGLAGNILIGGGIGAIIDHSKGTAYTYPSWIQLVFGKTMIFDRRAEQEGMPMQGVEPISTVAK